MDKIKQSQIPSENESNALTYQPRLITSACNRMVRHTHQSMVIQSRILPRPSHRKHNLKPNPTTYVPTRNQTKLKCTSGFHNQTASSEISDCLLPQETRPSLSDNAAN